MEVERTFISGCILDPIPAIPEDAKMNKTIFENITGQIIIHPDTRPRPLAWMNEVIPKMIMNNKTAEEKVRWAYAIPQGSWLEFDKKTKILSLCSLKKK